MLMGPMCLPNVPLRLTAVLEDPGFVYGRTSEKTKQL